MSALKTEQLLDLIRRQGIARARDLAALNLPREYLRRLHQQGVVVRLGRGLYQLAHAELSAHHSLAQACKRVPQGVVCLLSALRFHELTTQLPFQVWLAIDVKARSPRSAYPPLRIVRFSGAALTAGVEEHTIEGVTVKVYDAAKTVADCFKYRHKIGLDIALEALREYRHSPGYDADALWRYAKICRVANVMQPYLETLV